MPEGKSNSHCDWSEHGEWAHKAQSWDESQIPRPVVRNAPRRRRPIVLPRNISPLTDSNIFVGETAMTSFWQWLRAEIAPDGLSDTVLAFSSGAFAWVITDLLRALLEAAHS